MLRDRQLIRVSGGDFWPVGRELPRSQQGPGHSKQKHFSKKASSYELEIYDVPVLKKILGRVFKQNNHCFIIPHDKEIHADVPVLIEEIEKIKHGEIVWAELTKAGNLQDKVAAKILEVIGDENSPGIEIDAAIKAHELPSDWNEKVLSEIQKFEPEVSNTAKKDRVDLKNLNLITIDGEDARDFDDAVFCEQKSGGAYRLLVAIADVSFYVKPGMALDKEALNRGTSVYFPGRVIPMLPEILSNELCSLKPKVDRLCLVCDMHIDAEGKLTQYNFFEGLMCSQARLTYTEVASLLEGESQELAEIYAPVQENIQNLAQLYEILRSTRTLRGALDFDSTETKIIFNAEGKISRIEPRERNIAHKIIEECMLCANVSAAKFLSKQKIQTLYRIHDGPSPEKLSDLNLFLKELGLKLALSDAKPEPTDYAKLLSHVQNRPDAHIIENLLLRSLSQAIYSSNNIGHFGLAYEAYCHFTSPIRRYPDLLVHRQIRAVLQKQTEVLEQSQSGIEAIGVHCSMTERRADDATRDLTRWLKCQYISQHLGKAFDGIISGVTRFGFFVELKDLYIDGLVHVTNLQDDYYEFDPVRHRLIGSRLNKMFELGQKVEVKVSTINIEQRKIDFLLVSTKAKNSPQKESPRKKRKPKKTKD
ncbi:MAG: ribonuclease R [Gammaproteobacteria bacterium]